MPKVNVEHKELKIEINRDVRQKWNVGAHVPVQLLI